MGNTKFLNFNISIRGGGLNIKIKFGCDTTGLSQI